MATTDLSQAAKEAQDKITGLLHALPPAQQQNIMNQVNATLTYISKQCPSITALGQDGVTTLTANLYEILVTNANDESARNTAIANLVLTTISGQINLAKLPSDAKALATEVGAVVNEVAGVVKNPSFWKGCWESFKHCCCVVTDVVGKTLATAGESVAIGAVNGVIDGLNIGDTAKAALKVANQRSISTVFTAFRARLDVWTDLEANKKLIQDNAILQGALELVTTVAGDMPLSQVLGTQIIEIGGKQINLTDAASNIVRDTIAATKKTADAVSLPAGGGSGGAVALAAGSAEASTETVAVSAAAANSKAPGADEMKGAVATVADLRAAAEVMRAQVNTQFNDLYHQTITDPAHPEIVKALKADPTLAAFASNIAKGMSISHTTAVTHIHSMKGAATTAMAVGKLLQSAHTHKHHSDTGTPAAGHTSSDTSSHHESAVSPESVSMSVAGDAVHTDAAGSTHS